MSEHRGGCHCGNLHLSLHLSQAPAETRLRACSYSFCRAHNTRTTSDPDGWVHIYAADWSVVERYRFGTGTAEFLICKRCGVYIGAIGETASGTRAVTNISTTLPREARTAVNATFGSTMRSVGGDRHAGPLGRRVTPRDVGQHIAVAVLVLAGIAAM